MTRLRRQYKAVSENHTHEWGGERTFGYTHADFLEACKRFGPWSHDWAVALGVAPKTVVGWINHARIPSKGTLRQVFGIDQDHPGAIARHHRLVRLKSHLDTVAKYTGIPIATLSAFESGRIYLSRENTAKVEHVLMLAPGTLAKADKRWSDLAARRRALGLTQSDLAERVGVSRVTLSKIEATGRCSIRTAERIALAIHVPLKELKLSPSATSVDPSEL
jgi:DNA-binding XRE family transcriptional regulator